MPADRLLHPKAGKSRKLTMLTDLEYRVWTQYLLSADDFGVLHATVVKLQSDNLHIANRPVKMVQRCIDALVQAGLVHRFEHQGQPYVYQADWQRWQKVEYPRATDNPAPSSEALELCDDGTRELFAKHPGGQRKDRRRAEDDPNHSERASRTYPEGNPTTRAGARGVRLTANGIRLTATDEDALVAIRKRWGKSAIRDLPAGPLYDVWFQQFRDAYHPQGRADNAIVQDAFMAVFTRSPAAPEDIFRELMEAVTNHARGSQWAKGMVPAMLRWLEEGLYVQRHEGPKGEATGAAVPSAEETRRRYLVS